MKSTTVLRKKLGLKQADMAAYLSVTLSQLAMFETGKRDLPTSALQKLAEIELFLHQPTAKKVMRPHVTLQQAKARQVLEKHAKLLAYKQAFAARRLAAIQDAYAQKMLLLDLLDHLKSKSKTAATGRPHTAWLNMIEVKAYEGIKRNGLDKQAMQEIMLSGIRQQCEQAELLKRSNGLE